MYHHRACPSVSICLIGLPAWAPSRWCTLVYRQCGTKERQGWHNKKAVSSEAGIDSCIAELQRLVKGSCVWVQRCSDKAPVLYLVSSSTLSVFVAVLFFLMANGGNVAPKDGCLGIGRLESSGQKHTGQMGAPVLLPVGYCTVPLDVLKSSCHSHTYWF